MTNNCYFKNGQRTSKVITRKTKKKFLKIYEKLLKLLIKRKLKFYTIFILTD